MKKNKNFQLFWLCLVPFIMVLGNSMLIPVLPKIKSTLHISQLQVGLLITAFSVPAGIVIPMAGVLSDQVGRRKVMAPALVVYGIGGITAGLMAKYLPKPFWGIMLGRIIQGIGAGGTYQLAMAMTGDMFKAQKRTFALGLLEASNGLGKVVSPILGSLFALISWRFPFFVYGFMAVPAGIALYFFTEEKAQFQKQSLQNYLDALKEIFQNKAAGLLSSFFAGMVALFTLFGVLSLYSDMLEKDFKIFGFKKGLVMAGPVFIMAALSFFLGFLLQRTKNKGLKIYISVGLFLTMLGQGLFVLLKGFWLKFFSLLILGTGVGLIMTPVNTLVTGSCGVKRRGIITCLYGSLRFFGVAIGPPLYGLTEKHGMLPVIGALSATPLLSFILTIFLVNQKTIMSQGQKESSDQKASSTPDETTPSDLKESLEAPSKKPFTLRRKVR